MFLKHWEVSDVLDFLTCEVKDLSPWKFECLCVGLDYDMISHFFGWFRAEPRSTLEYNIVIRFYIEQLGSLRERSFLTCGKRLNVHHEGWLKMSRVRSSTTCFVMNYLVFVTVPPFTISPSLWQFYACSSLKIDEPLNSLRLDETLVKFKH